MYNNWFRGNGDSLHPHILSTSIPVGQHINLMRFRLGCADLAANNGQRSCAKNRVPRGDRVCTLPNCGGIENELHAIFECKANTHIRLSSEYSGLFENVQTGDMRAFFNGAKQSAVASFITTIANHRKDILLSLKYAKHNVVTA